MNDVPAHEIGLAFGSNMGDRPGNILEALRLLQQNGGIGIKTVSPLYLTAPWGLLDQEAFANLCAIAETQLGPFELLAEVKQIEVHIGRAPGQRWGPRSIDIDILFYSGISLDTEVLTLPHRELFNRAFVLVPLADAAPALRVADRAVAQAAAAMDRKSINPWKRRQA